MRTPDRAEIAEEAAANTRLGQMAKERGFGKVVSFGEIDIEDRIAPLVFTFKNK